LFNPEKVRRDALLTADRRDILQAFGAEKTSQILPNFAMPVGLIEEETGNSYIWMQKKSEEY
jgi:hypothetical protein